MLSSKIKKLRLKLQTIYKEVNNNLEEKAKELAVNENNSSKYRKGVKNIQAQIDKKRDNAKFELYQYANKVSTIYKSWGDEYFIYQLKENLKPIIYNKNKDKYNNIIDEIIQSEDYYNKALKGEKIPIEAFKSLFITIKDNSTYTHYFGTLKEYEVKPKLSKDFSFIPMTFNNIHNVNEYVNKLYERFFSV